MANGQSQRRLYYRRKEKGLCPNCGRERMDKTFTTCEVCRENKRKSVKAGKIKNEKE